MLLTIKELAQLAGVSKGTVSRVLNEQEGVGSETRKRIKTLIANTGYTPKAAAQQLAQNKTRTIGAVIPAQFGTSGFYWSAVISALSKASCEHSYVLTLHPLLLEPRDFELVQLARSSRIDGLILFGDPADPQLIEELQKQTLPLAIIGDSGSSTVQGISVDNYGGGIELGRGLINKGAGNILCFAGSKQKLSVRNRIRGLKKALGKNVTMTVMHLNYSQDSYKKINKAITENQFDGIAVTSGDFVLPIVQRFLKERISCATAFFDDDGVLPLFEHSIPNSIVVSQDIPRIAYEAINCIIHSIQTKETKKSDDIIIPVKVIKL